MKKGDLIIATVWMVFGIVIAMSSHGLGLGSLTSPGPGLMPFGVGIILSLCSVPILIGSLMNTNKGGENQEQGVWTEVDFKKIGLVLASLTGYSLLLERLGFLVTAFSMLLILFKVVGSERLSWALIETVLTVFFAYLLFVVLLNVYMPSFPLRIG